MRWLIFWAMLVTAGAAILYPLWLDEVADTPIVQAPLFVTNNGFQPVDVSVAAQNTQMRVFAQAQAIGPAMQGTPITVYGYQGTKVVFTSTARFKKVAANGNQHMASAGSLKLEKAGAIRFVARTDVGSEVPYDSIKLVLKPTDSDTAFAVLPLFNRDNGYKPIDVPLDVKNGPVRVFLVANTAFAKRGKFELQLFAERGKTGVFYSSAMFSTISGYTKDRGGFLLSGNAGVMNVEETGTYRFYAVANGQDEIGINHIQLVIKPAARLADKRSINLAFGLATFFLLAFATTRYTSWRGNERKPVSADGQQVPAAAGAFSVPVLVVSTLLTLGGAGLGIVYPSVVISNPFKELGEYTVFDRRTGVGRAEFGLDAKDSPFTFNFTMTPLGTYARPNSISVMVIKARINNKIAIQQSISFSNGSAQQRVAARPTTFFAAINDLQLTQSGKYVLEIEKTNIEDLPVRDVQLTILGSNPSYNTKLATYGLIALALGLAGLVLCLMKTAMSARNAEPNAVNRQKWGRDAADR